MRFALRLAAGYVGFSIYVVVAFVALLMVFVMVFACPSRMLEGQSGLFNIS
jgi:hypothetical protein